MPGSLADLGPLDSSPRAYLLVFEGTGSSIFYLPPGGEVVIGRGDECQLRLAHPSTSRRHACLRRSAQGVFVSDLGSHNGTQVNGDTVRAPRMLYSGDVIGVSQATLVFHQAGASDAPRVVLDHEAFRRRLEEEVDRAQRYERPVSLAAMNLDAKADAAALPQSVGKLLRRIDVLGWGAPRQLLVLLPEHDAEAAGALALRLARAAAQASLGHATFPAEAADASGLLQAARSAAMAARPGRPHSAAEALATVTLGERAVVVADPAMVQLYELLRKLAGTDLPVLVCGETGVGKENAALALHLFSKRQGRKLVPINCAALPESLVEAELFGHAAGAFTGAIAAKVGLLESAHGGTVFLDEVGELPLGTQAKLLRVLETRRVQRLGEVHEREADVRLVAATNRDLRAEVEAGRFRQDLYFRVGATTVLIPPLRDRRSEIPLLSQAFLVDACQRAGRSPMTIAPATLQRLFAHEWPGNIRELRNAIEYAVAMGSDAVLEPWMLPEALQAPAHAPAEAASDPPPGSGRRFRPLAEEIREIERRRIAEALEATGGVQKEAAALLQMPIRTFIVKLEQYGLKAPPRRRGGNDG